MSAELLAPNVGYCLYISSISAYASFAKPNDENSPTGKLADPDIDETTDETYGPMKALCEQYSAQAFKGRGQHRSARLYRRTPRRLRPLYLLARTRFEGRRNAGAGHAARSDSDHRRTRPGGVDDDAGPRTHHRVFQCHLAAASVHHGRHHHGEPARQPSAGTKATWVPEDFLAMRWKPEELDLPPWSPMSGETAGASLTSTARAQKAGLKRGRCSKRCTIRSSGFIAGRSSGKLRAGFDSQKEIVTLRAWHIGGGKSGNHDCVAIHSSIQCFTPCSLRNSRALAPCSIASVESIPASVQLLAATVTDLGACGTGQPVLGLSTCP